VASGTMDGQEGVSIFYISVWNLPPLPWKMTACGNGRRFLLFAISIAN